MFHISYGVATHIEQRQAAIDCPVCGAKAVPATASQHIERLKLLGLIPIMKLRSTWIECGQCREVINCFAPLDIVSKSSPAEITPFLRYHPTPAGKALSIAGLCTSIIPVLGVIISGLAMYVCRGTRGWTTQVNLISICLSAAITIVVILMMFIH